MVHPITSPACGLCHRWAAFPLAHAEGKAGLRRPYGLSNMWYDYALTGATFRKMRWRHEREALRMAKDRQEGKAVL